MTPDELAGIGPAFQPAPLAHRSVVRPMTRDGIPVSDPGEVHLERMLWLRDLGERCLAESVIRRQMAQLRLLAPGSVRDRTLTPWPFS